MNQPLHIYAVMFIKTFILYRYKCLLHTFGNLFGGYIFLNYIISIQCLDFLPGTVIKRTRIPSGENVNFR